MTVPGAAGVSIRAYRNQAHVACTRAKQRTSRMHPRKTRAHTTSVAAAFHGSHQHAQLPGGVSTSSTSGVTASGAAGVSIRAASQARSGYSTSGDRATSERVSTSSTSGGRDDKRTGLHKFDQQPGDSTQSHDERPDGCPAARRVLLPEPLTRLTVLACPPG